MQWISRISFGGTYKVFAAHIVPIYVVQVILSFSPNRFTCMGFLLLSKGCIPGPHDFASVSGLASHSGCLGPHEFTPVFHLSFTLVSHSGYLRPHEFTLVFHLSPALVSHSGCLGPHEFTLVSHLSLTLVSHSGCLGPHEFTLVFHTCLPDRKSVV